MCNWFHIGISLGAVQFKPGRYGTRRERGFGIRTGKAEVGQGDEPPLPSPLSPLVPSGRRPSVCAALHFTDKGIGIHGVNSAAWTAAGKASHEASI